MAPDYVFVAESVVKNFTKALIDSIKRFYGESPNGSDQMGKIVNDFHMKRLTDLLDSSNGQIIYGGRTNEAARHMQPTLVLNPKVSSQLMTEEIFGPILPIMTYKNFDEVVSFIRDRPKPLAVYFMGHP